MLAANRIGLSFGGIQALKDVSFEVASGEIVGLIGSNGAGKSTMINVLSGFARPSTGTVTLGGEALSRLPPEAIARKGVVRTFQAVRLFARFTVAENVAAAAAVRRLSEPQIAEILQAMGLDDLAERRAGSLPYALQRKLAVARALALEPRFLLLDEPAAGMTAEEVAEFDATLVSLRDQTGIGLLLVEHNMALVMGVCERLVVMDRGRVIARGTPEVIGMDPAVRAAYLGTEVEEVA